MTGVKILSAVALLLFVAGVYGAVSRYNVPDAPPTPADLLAISPSTVELPDVVIGHHTMHFTITNTSKTTAVVVLSGAKMCDENCCYRPITDTRIALEPGQSTPFDFDIQVYVPGPFSATLQLFADEGVLRTYAIPLTGTVVPAAVEAK